MVRRAAWLAWVGVALCGAGCATSGGHGGVSTPTSSSASSVDAGPDHPAWRVLSALHEAASQANGERYFALFAPNAVFLGTDPDERWTLAGFKAFAEPYFAAGRGWTYHMVTRHLRVSGDARTAWFDEELFNESYGRCRGSGVLVRGDDGVWRIAQYNLTIPVPNDLADDLVARIRAWRAERGEAENRRP